MVERRRYRELKGVADEYARRGDWSLLVSEIHQHNPEGKSRDALVSLLELESVGGTDTDIFKEFLLLEGDTLDEIRAEAHGVAIELLREQIASRHTYFLDVQAMASTCFAVLIDDILEVRRKEIQSLNPRATRLDVLETYYGFVVLTTDGSVPRNRSPRHSYAYLTYRSWLDEEINPNAAAAIRSLTDELADGVDMDTRYLTLGSNSFFRKRCRADTARILGDAVRLSLYKMPGNRVGAAKNLGETGDSRALGFLHSRLRTDPSGRVRTAVAQAIGSIGHERSVEVMLQYIQSIEARYSKALSLAVRALGNIDTDATRDVLADLMRTGSNTVKAAAIECLSRLTSPSLLTIASSHVRNSSKPVARAAILALIRLGAEGQKVLRANATTILERLMHDRPSRGVLKQLLSVEGIRDDSSVQFKLSLRVDILKQMIQRIRREQERGPSSEYHRRWLPRRERKMRDELEGILEMVGGVSSPCVESLTSEIQKFLSTLPPVRGHDSAGTLVHG
ncbi:MAG: hypothetical protein DRO87_03425 [Candidatus Thorarchaeota archaeon]|nr:MAG: hypothetical protein DRP09_08715 [Candidatus Thorarchaeota archaeon]RLI59300.1 MAG: hypothetical protein DRO87_03425 [Candidatus Thorarchaeota archaeon]